MPFHIPTKQAKSNEIIRSLKVNSKHNQRDPKHDIKQAQNYKPKLLQFDYLQTDAVETWQSRPFELTVYFAQKAAAEFAFMYMNFRSI